MTRFLVMWRENPNIRAPEDPSKAAKLYEMFFATIDEGIKNGLVEEFGFFPDGTTGYAIGKGEAADVFRSVNMFQPYILFEVCQEIIPYEKGKGVMRALVKDMIAATKK